MKPNHSQTIRTLVSPTQNHHKTRNTSKSNQFDLRRLAGVHHRQAVQPKTQNLCCSHVSPGGQGCAARRFLFRNPNDTLFICKINVKNIVVIKSILRCFKLASRLKVNLHKSRVWGDHFCIIMTQ